MATKKDLVEAHAFSRRRLVTAFVSGAPGGREVEPARPGRTIVGGVALAVLLVAGAAIAGIFSPRVPEGWADQPGLIISDDTGAAYVITDDAVTEAEETGAGPVLRPVINITSAMLILGADVTPEIVPQSAIDAETIGDDIGILNAPASVPSPSLLIDTGWSACTADRRGVRFVVSDEPGVTPVDGGFVVEADGDYHLVARARDDGAGEPSAHRYALPGNRATRDSILAELDLPPSVNATRVTGEWLSLFPAGGPLTPESFGLTGAGEPVTYAGPGTGLPPDSRVGDVVQTPSETVLLHEDGPAELDAFALAVYRHLPDPRPPRVRTVSETLQVARGHRPYLDARWPDTTLGEVLGEQCALLRAAPGEQPIVVLAGDPASEASSEDVLPSEKSVAVDAGRGAYVLSGDWADTEEGAPYLVDAKGAAYPLVGLGTAELLGFEGYDAPVVPDSWVELFETGVNLSQDAALCPPDPVAGRTCD